MSKEKPETDDIFEDRYGKKIRIDDRTYDRKDCFFVYILVFDVGSGKEYIENDIVSLDVLKNCTYLGKSKVNVEKLFDVEKENEKDNLATDLKQIVRDSAKQTREIIDNWSKGVV